MTSQLPLEHWHDNLGDPTLADAILDRLVHNAGNPPLEPRGLEVEFFPKEEVLHEKVKIYG